MKRSGSAERGSGQVPTDTCLLARPLDFISEDHLRERQICAEIDGLVATVVFNRQAGVTVLRFLNEELGVHLRDEVEDLFPVLARRCTEADAIDTVLGRIRQDQDQALSLLPSVRGAIANCLDAGADLSSEDREVLACFAAHVRRHLVAENAILLPIARVRLTRGDLRRLAGHMRSRRGISTGSEIANAD